MARAIYYDLETKTNNNLDQNLTKDPKILLMLRLADTIISQSGIDHLMFELIENFMKLSESEEIKKELERSIGFEQKRVLLAKILNQYSVDKDGDILNMLKGQNIDLKQFIKDLQDTEKPRNNLAHDDTLREILLASMKEDLKQKDPELLKDKKFCELTGLSEIEETIKINDIYHRYNEILEPYNFLLDILEQGCAEDLVREILELPSKEIVEGEDIFHE